MYPVFIKYKRIEEVRDVVALGRSRRERRANLQSENGEPSVLVAGLWVAGSRAKIFHIYAHLFRTYTLSLFIVAYVLYTLSLFIVAYLLYCTYHLETYI